MQPQIRILSILDFVSFGATAQQRGHMANGTNTSISSQVGDAVGNSTYVRAFPTSPPNDARAISQTLSRLGFEVETLTDTNQKSTGQAINQFEGKLRNRGGVGLFYYAGHEMQV